MQGRCDRVESKLKLLVQLLRVLASPEGGGEGMWGIAIMNCFLRKPITAFLITKRMSALLSRVVTKMRFDL